MAVEVSRLTTGVGGLVLSEDYRQYLERGLVDDYRQFTTSASVVFGDGSDVAYIDTPDGRVRTNSSEHYEIL
jgi:hypothetical protein